MKFASDEGDPPLCAIVSEKTVQLLVFPYSAADTAPGARPVPVVDCVVLPELPLFLETETGPTVNSYLLALLLLLCTNAPNNITPLHKKPKIMLRDSTKKVTIRGHIRTVTEEILEKWDEVQSKNETFEREKWRFERETSKLEREKEVWEVVKMKFEGEKEVWDVLKMKFEGEKEVLKRKEEVLKREEEVFKRKEKVLEEEIGFLRLAQL